jgi:hypothetical protein
VLVIQRSYEAAADGTIVFPDGWDRGMADCARPWAADTVVGTSESPT